MAGEKQKKGASILSFNLPAIIRFATGWHKVVTDVSSKNGYGVIMEVGAKSKMLNLLFPQNTLLKSPAIIL